MSEPLRLSWTFFRPSTPTRLSTWSEEEWRKITEGDFEGDQRVKHSFQSKYSNQKKRWKKSSRNRGEVARKKGELTELTQRFLRENVDGTEPETRRAGERFKIGSKK